MKEKIHIVCRPIFHPRYLQPGSLARLSFQGQLLSCQATRGYLTKGSGQIVPSLCYYVDRLERGVDSKLVTELQVFWYSRVPGKRLLMSSHLGLPGGVKGV